MNILNFVKILTPFVVCFSAILTCVEKAQRIKKNYDQEQERQERKTSYRTKKDLGNKRNNY